MSKIKVNINGVEEEIEVEDSEELNRRGIHVVKDKKKKRYDMRGRIIGATPLISIFLYLAICFIGEEFGVKLWHPAWVIFLINPIMPILLYGFRRGKAIVMTLTTVVVTIAYIIVGVTWNLWHPAWIMFLIIPIVQILVRNFEIRN